MNLEQRVASIEERNKKVEQDKAWETSLVRRSFIVVVTYVIAYVWLRIISVDNALLAALVPTGGYILSTLSLLFLRKKWQK